MNNPGIAVKFKEAAIREGLYIASKKDIPRLVDTSVDGYGSAYPLCQWFDQGGDGTQLAVRELHPKGWRSTWKANISDVFDQSIVVADSPAINALLMWLVPYFKEAGNLDWFLHGGLESLFHMGIKEMVRFDTYETYCNAQRHKYGEGSFYASNLVVRESQKGRGLGGHLMRTSLRIIRNLGSSAYLETHTRRNMELYRKLGFKLMCDDPIPGTRLKHYAMRME